ncbi:ABC transporter ATP-binding protein [Sphingobium sp.]|uniref:ABC transporter ATP-binding protein n=1 Tax=Sphingobium sp. TaxID=1912891 RepID=UPI0035C6FBD9
MPETVPTPIEIDGVDLSYGSHKVLDQLCLRVSARTIYALLGGNGAGKSTTLSVLLGFTKPDAGHVRVDGFDPTVQSDTVRKRIAYLPENVALYEHLTAVENADYLLALSGERTSRSAIVGAFEAAGLQERAWDQRLGGFSKGMRQKVAIAVALLREVPVLLLDEPTSGLDPRATADFNRLLLTVRDRGTAILMVTHDLMSAVDVADRIGFIDGGRIVDEVAAQDAGRFDLRALHDCFAREGAAA